MSTNYLKTFLKPLILSFILTFGIVGWGQETEIYATGFESSEGFTAGTTYNNTTVAHSGPVGEQWGTYYGTPSTTTPIEGGQSMQMRWYTGNADHLGHTFTNFELPNVTKVEFKAKNTAGINVIASYSTDEGITWVGDQTFVLSTSTEDFTYNIS